MVRERTLVVSCKQVSELLSQARERRLTLAERVTLRIHLVLCEGCRNFRVQLGVLHEAVRRFVDRGRGVDQ